MLTAIKKNRSLTFYQQPVTAMRKDSPAYAKGTSAAATASISYQTSSIITGYNRQLQTFLTDLNLKRSLDASRLDLTKPNSAARSQGVKRAWEYEKADVEMGGSGSSNWSKEQRAEIKSTGKVRGAEGHHQKNVADHPAQQADPDNIKFYEDRSAHLHQGHQGDFHNSTDADPIDKNAMLKRTNTKRVWRKDIQGLGMAVAIGAGIGMTIGFITTLAQSGVTPDTLKLALAEGAKGGLESGLLGGVGYGIGRTVSEVITQALGGTLGKLAPEMAQKLTGMINMGVVGTLTILAVSTYQFIKLKCHGVATKEALIQTGKQALFSLSLLAVSIAAQGIWGGAAGMIVSISIGVIFISYSVADSVHQRHFADRVRVYMIEKCCPQY